MLFTFPTRFFPLKFGFVANVEVSGITSSSNAQPMEIDSKQTNLKPYEGEKNTQEGRGGWIL